MPNTNINKEIQSRLIISSTTARSGKTTVSLALIRALKRRGLTVQSFKNGPDFLDTKYGELVSERLSFNLDRFLQTIPHKHSVFKKYSCDADACIIDGYKAYYDGYDRTIGSTSQLSEDIDAPVILVVDASQEGYSLAAQISGFLKFREPNKILGVFFNFVRSEIHLKSLQTACEDIGVRVLGYLYNDDSISISFEDNLGKFFDDKEALDAYIDKVADLVEESLDIDSLLQETMMPRLMYNSDESKLDFKRTFTIAVARDKAFCFFYNENIQCFKEKAKIIYFSPLKDKALPQADFIYMPSGYTEFYLKELSENTEMLKSLHNYIEGGGYILAEGGSMFYLSNSIIGYDNIKYPMVGIYNQDGVYSSDYKLIEGYRTINFKKRLFKSFEYRQSAIIDPDKDHYLGTIIRDVEGNTMPANFFRYRNAVAGFTRIYWAEHGLIEVFSLLLDQEPLYD